MLGIAKLLLRAEWLCGGKGSALTGKYSLPLRVRSGQLKRRRKVSRKGVSIHLNKTKQNKTPIKEKSSGNPGGMGDGEEDIPKPETICAEAIKKDSSQTPRLFSKCRKGILACYSIPESSLSLFFWKVKPVGKQQKAKATAPLWCGLEN